MARFLASILLLAALALALSGGRVQGLTPALEIPTVQAASDARTTYTEVLAPLVDEDDDRHMWGDWDNWGWWLFMPMMVVFWVGVIALVVWLVRQTAGSSSNRGDSAIEIARRRYARGEISREEFEQIRRDLGG